MQTLLTSRFFSAIDRLTSHVVDIASKLCNTDLEWISSNRDFGEDERYRAKDNVDESLLSSAATTRERETIESCFAEGSLVQQYEAYIALLDTTLDQTHTQLVDAARESTAWTLHDHANFWQAFAPVADADNAHAMYLSSGNWDFSVFNPTIDRIDAWTLRGDPQLYQDVLTAGVQDIRTSVYSEYGAAYLGLSRADFVSAMRERNDWQRSGGILTLMSYAPATGIRGVLESSNQGTNLSSKFNSAVATLADLYPGEPVHETVDLFRQMNMLRRSYDIYEYFGAYCLLRNVAIRRTMKALAASHSDAAERFAYLATTYQYRSAELTIREAVS
jgi:hypothetical protein